MIPLLVLSLRALADPALTPQDSKYYTIHTDLPAVEAREAALRMTRMADEYAARTGTAPPAEKLPFFLYKNPADYTAAGGAPNSAGVFNGQRLMALTLRRDDGLISLATWQVVQHEGFHQFANANLAARGGADLPMWLDEGLAEYFGQALFTGDGFVTGLVPQSRLMRVQTLLLKDPPLNQLTALTREQWNAKIDLAHYDLAWSLVHFLAHGDDGRLQKPLTAYIGELGKGTDPQTAYDRLIAPIPDLERRWRTYWLTRPDHPSADLYARATLAMLTSYLARAHAAGQPFPSFDALVKTPPDQLRLRDDDWLPPSLFQMAVHEAAKMRKAGDAFALAPHSSGVPQLLLTLKDGTRLAGRFTLNPTRRVRSVQTEVLFRAPVTRPTSRAAIHATGELVR